jgi:hypothetical protein
MVNHAPEMEVSSQMTGGVYGGERTSISDNRYTEEAYGYIIT